MKLALEEGRIKEDTQELPQEMKHMGHISRYFLDTRGALSLPTGYDHSVNVY